MMDVMECLKGVVGTCSSAWGGRMDASGEKSHDLRLAWWHWAHGRNDWR